MARYWLGPWVWNSTRPQWEPPTSTVASLDLRSPVQCGTAGPTPLGVGIFVTGNAVDLGADYDNMGTDPLAIWNSQAKLRWASVLALPAALDANNLRDAVWETLSIQSDPTGLDRALPIIPTIHRRYELWLAGQLAASKQFHLLDPEATPLIDLLKRIYRALREASLNGEHRDKLGQIDFSHYRKVLGSWVNKYRVHYRSFQPSDLPDEEPLPPETKVTDNFTRADGDTIGNLLTWTEQSLDWDTTSNKVTLATVGIGIGLARAESDLSSSDHYSQATIETDGVSSDPSQGPTARFSASASTCYGCLNYRGDNNIYLSKIVAGVNTNLANTPATINVGEAYRVQCNGSVIKGFKSGVERLSITDTSIPGNLRCGLVGYRGGSGLGTVLLDNFEAADITEFGLRYDYSKFSKPKLVLTPFKSPY